MSKNREKIVKILGIDTAQELEAMDAESLKKVVVDASNAIRVAKEELEANEKYQAFKAALQDLTGAKRDLDSRQKAKIAYGLELLEEKGK